MEQEPEKQPHKEPVTLKACLIHEGKKVYWFTAKGLVILAGIYIGWLAGLAVLPNIIEMFNAGLVYIWSLVILVIALPWYILAAIGLVTIPAVYTVAVCLARRYKICWPMSKAETFYVAYLSFGGMVFMVSMWLAYG